MLQAGSLQEGSRVIRKLSYFTAGHHIRFCNIVDFCNLIPRRFIEGIDPSYDHKMVIQSIRHAPAFFGIQDDFNLVPEDSVVSSDKTIKLNYRSDRSLKTLKQGIFSILEQIEPFIVSADDETSMIEKITEILCEKISSEELYMFKIRHRVWCIASPKMFNISISPYGYIIRPLSVQNAVIVNFNKKIPLKKIFFGSERKFEHLAEHQIRGLLRSLLSIHPDLTIKSLGNYDSLITNSHDLSDLLMKTCGKNTPKLKKLVGSKLVASKDTDSYETSLVSTSKKFFLNENTVAFKKKPAVDTSLIFKLSLCRDMDINYIHSIIENHAPTLTKDTHHYTTMSQKDVSDFMGNLTANNKVKLLSYPDISLVIDLVSIWRINKDRGDVLEIPRYFKDSKQLHDDLVRQSRALEEKRNSYSIEYPKYVSVIDKKRITVDDKVFEIFLPKNSADLLWLGSTLHNCIGTIYKISNISDNIATFNSGKDHVIFGLKDESGVVMASRVRILTDADIVRIDQLPKFSMSSSFRIPGVLDFTVFMEETRFDNNKDVGDKIREAIPAEICRILENNKTEFLDEI